MHEESNPKAGHEGDQSTRRLGVDLSSMAPPSTVTRISIADIPGFEKIYIDELLRIPGGTHQGLYIDEHTNGPRRYALITPLISRHPNEGSASVTIAAVGYSEYLIKSELRARQAPDRTVEDTIPPASPVAGNLTDFLRQNSGLLPTIKLPGDETPVVGTASRIAYDQPSFAIMIDVADYTARAIVDTFASSAAGIVLAEGSQGSGSSFEMLASEMQPKERSMLGLEPNELIVHIDDNHFYVYETPGGEHLIGKGPYTNREILSAFTGRTGQLELPSKNTAICYTRGNPIGMVTRTIVDVLSKARPPQVEDDD